jgi:DtxR family Mn-dependent transcriptional regulator
VTGDGEAVPAGDAADPVLDLVALELDDHVADLTDQVVVVLVAAPSVTAMVKRLSAASLVHHEPRAGVTLTDHGQEHALRIIRRHRLLETFLAQILGVPWDQVHAEAEVLEHALSEQLEDRIDAVLGRPTRDPHGDPIPPKAGSHVERWGEALDSVDVGSRFLVERVSDRDSEALRYLAGLGIGPSVSLTVEERAPFGGPLWVRVGDQRHALGLPLAALVHGSIKHGSVAE